MERKTRTGRSRSEPPATPAAGPERLDSALLKLAGIVVVGALASLLDTAILSVAIDGLGRRFDALPATVQRV
ncbi:hypothetical protein [Actinocorallia libanotica]|uniref:MFS transporter n=1 Tax=Actinocorallia libanotica TaxID=46162 RepID=A0ABP4BUY8_9ACTN